MHGFATPELIVPVGSGEGCGVAICAVGKAVRNVGALVGESVGESVGEPVRETVGEPVGETVGEPVGETVGTFNGHRVKFRTVLELLMPPSTTVVFEAS